MTLSTIVLGGGCFWCTESVYKEVRGITDVESGYSNGQAERPSYEDVCTGRTGCTDGAAAGTGCRRCTGDGAAAARRDGPGPSPRDDRPGRARWKPFPRSAGNPHAAVPASMPPTSRMTPSSFRIVCA